MSRIATVVLCMLMSLGVYAEDSDAPEEAERPSNIDDDGHDWMASHLDEAMPYLIQTVYGPMESDHIHVVKGLGEWAARRGRSRHQGTDFVLDVPHETRDEELLVGALIDGTIVHLEQGWGSYGNTVFLYRDEAPKMLFLYAHLRRIDVEMGAEIRVGDVLGAFGCTGNCRKLRGRYLQKQVHVEVYQLPDDFEPTSINWDKMPMKQLRGVAVQDHKRAHGIDITHYFSDFELERLSTSELKKRYKSHCKEKRLEKYFSDLNEDEEIPEAGN